MINVLIADDHPVVRKGLRQLLEDDAHCRFGRIDEACSGREALELLSGNEYDLLILDISMPDRNGLDVLKDVKLSKPALPVLILSIFPEDQYGIRAIRLGASGYVTKSQPPEELINAVITIAKGGRYISDSLADHIISRNDVKEQSIENMLSARELQVLGMIGSGKSIKEISFELSVSPKTFSTYRARIIRKLNLKSTADLIKLVIERNLVSGKEKDSVIQ